MNSPKDMPILERIKNSIIFRIMVMGILILMLLIPCAMIGSLIDERENRRDSVINEINSKWALEQTIGGPILEIPYKVYKKTKCIEDDKVKEILNEEIHTAYFLPDRLHIKGNILPEIRYRGIYKSVVYTADLEISGNFTFPDFSGWKIPDDNIIWDQAVLSFGISEMRGINKKLSLEWNDSHLTPKPGLRNYTVFLSGISTDIDMSKNEKQSNTFSMKLNIRGSKRIQFLPLGRQTNVHIDSSWSSPSFNGLFLPKNREIDKNGFKADWEIFDYNRDLPQQWKGDTDQHRFSSVGFGLDLFQPVDEYQKTTRSIKYSILFITLTFLGFFLVIELLNKRVIHPIQYLLVGAALCMFYLLLISLTEHLTFDTAYLISAVCIVGLTTVYTRSLSGKFSLTALMGTLFTALYGFLYVMLRLEDYSLLVGSMGLFIILAAVMLFTRKIDWYTYRLERQKADG